MQEGRLLESSIASAVRQSSDLAMLPSKAMPIVPAAREIELLPDPWTGFRVV
jgi:hypothetical protein